VFINHAGQLAPRASYDFGSRPASLAVADVDGDALSDLIATSWGFLPMKDSSPIIGIFHNNGAGTFQWSGKLSVVGAPSVVAAADFDADGSADLALGYDFDDELSLYRGLGGGRYAAAEQYATGTSPVALVSADFDRDGRLDLLSADKLGSELSFLRGAADRGFEPRVSYPTVQSPLSLAVGDFDGDGWLDVAVAGFADNAVGLFFGECR
jgi:hypothetical protein